MSLPPFDPAGPHAAIIRLESGEVTVSIADAGGLRRDLAAALRRAGWEDGEALARQTEQAPIWIDEGGVVRIGAWILQSAGDRLRLRLRLEPLTSGRAVVAFFSRDRTGWSLERIDREFIVPR